MIYLLRQPQNLVLVATLLLNFDPDFILSTTLCDPDFSIILFVVNPLLVGYSFVEVAVAHIHRYVSIVSRSELFFRLDQVGRQLQGQREG